MSINGVAVAVFLAFIASTLLITAWASRRVRSTKQFYAAGASITPLQNGLAISGDYLSAASFLGTIAVFFSLGTDGLYYAVGAIAGWPLATCLIAERLRKLGSYTFADVLCHRLRSRPIRILAAVSTLCVCMTYLLAQIVGAGLLVQVLFHVRYEFAVGLVAGLMIVYVMFGGMIATTWIQILKATVLIGTSMFMVLLLLHLFGGDFGKLAALAAAPQGSDTRLAATHGLLTDPFSAGSLALAFVFGPAGMPHLLMRFFTVRDPPSARRSLMYASCIIALFQCIVIVLGYGAVALITGDNHYESVGGVLLGGQNMAAVYLAHRLGGSVLFGIVAAVTFATILAVVSGLTLTAASAVSHDLFKNALRAGQASEASELQISRFACIVIGFTAAALSLLLQRQNVGFLATLPLVIAASANFPILLLAIYWRGLTTLGAVAGGYVGLILSVSLMLLSPKVWIEVLGRSHSWFHFDYPTAISLPAAFLVAWLISLAQRLSSRGAFDKEVNEP